MENNNLVWHNHKVTKTDRNNLNNHKSFVIWLTGLSGSGKSTLATAIEEKLFSKKIITYVLDGDNIRQGLNKNLGFSDEDRKENIRRIAEVSKLFVDAGTVVITAFISPFKEERALARNLVESGEFVEIFVDCSLEVCESRDPKGLYKKARSGQLKQFTGIDSPYEVPVNPELILNTSSHTVEECVKQVYDYLIKKELIND